MAYTIKNSLQVSKDMIFSICFENFIISKYHFVPLHKKRNIVIRNIETQKGNGYEIDTFDLTTNSLNINLQKLEIKLKKPANETIKTQCTVSALSTSS